MIGPDRLRTNQVQTCRGNDPFNLDDSAGEMLRYVRHANSLERGLHLSRDRDGKVIARGKRITRNKVQNGMRASRLEKSWGRIEQTELESGHGTWWYYPRGPFLRSSPTQT